MADVRLIDATPIVKFIENGMNNPNRAEAFGSDATEILAEIMIATTIDPDEDCRAQWISVEDRLPELFVPVIVCRKFGKDERRVEQGCRDVNGWWKVYGTRTKNVTHWMPLPEPPERKKC